MADDLYGSPEHQLFRRTVRKFVQEELVPRAREFDEMGHFDKSLYKKMGALGMLGAKKYQAQIERLSQTDPTYRVDGIHKDYWVRAECARAANKLAVR